MSVTILCPSCEFEQQIDASRAGKEVACLNCSKPLRVDPPNRRRPKWRASWLVGLRRLAPARALAGLRRAWRSASLILAGGLSLILTAVFYLGLVYPLSGSRFGDLFGGRGWVPYVIVDLTFWATALLGMKYSKLRRDVETLRYDLLPEKVGKAITSENTPHFLRRLEQWMELSPIRSENVLVRRLQQALHHFRAQGTVQEVVDQLHKQGESDAEAVEASFTLVKVIVWAIPILGFIGTVLGLGDAIGSFSNSLNTTQLAGGGEYMESLDSIKASLGQVTRGLGVAFDTTLIALAASLLIMFPSSSLQRLEEGFLAKVKEYCDDNLVRRLLDGRKTEAAAAEIAATEQLVQIERTVAAKLQRTLAETLAEHHALLQTEAEKLEQIGEVLVEKLGEAWTVLLEQISGQQLEQLARLDRTLSASAAVQLESARQVAASGAAVDQALDHLGQRTQEIQAELAERIGGRMNELGGVLDRLRHEAQTSTAANVQATVEATDRLERSLRQLSHQAKDVRLDTAKLLVSQLTQIVDGSSSGGES